MLVGFVCIGSSFAANADDSSNLNDLTSDSNLHISDTNANVNSDVVVNDVDSNNHIECSSISVNSNAIVSKSSNKNLIRLYPRVGNKAFVSSEDDIKNALKNNCSEIILASDITVNKAIEISKDNITIDGKGHTIKTCEKSSKNLFIINKPDCTICNCIFNNSAKHCIAIYSRRYSTIDIINCTFNGFNTEDDGAAIYIGSFSYVNKVVNCTFNNCSASSGGAIYIGPFVNCSVSHCKFINISANKYGAIYLGGHKGYVYKCIFRNVTTNGTRNSKGTVIFCYRLDSVIRESIFYVKCTDYDIIRWDQPWYHILGLWDDKKGLEDKCIYHWLTIGKI